MLVQKKVSIQGEWAKAKIDLFTGDIIKILNGGQIIPGDFGDRHCFKIETKNGEKILSFNQTTMNYLIDAFGFETDKWINQQVKVWLIKSNVQGKMRDVVYLTAPDWIEGDDGFYPPINKKSAIKDMRDIPVVEESEEINPSDIPF